MKTKVKTTQITTLGLMMAILLLMAYTPLGYLNIGPLAITFNVIPVAISAIALGPAGGAAAGSIFGLSTLTRYWPLSRDSSPVFWMDCCWGIFSEECGRGQTLTFPVLLQDFFQRFSIRRFLWLPWSCCSETQSISRK